MFKWWDAERIHRLFVVDQWIAAACYFRVFLWLDSYVSSIIRSFIWFILSIVMHSSIIRKRTSSSRWSLILNSAWFWLLIEVSQLEYQPNSSSTNQLIFHSSADFLHHQVVHLVISHLINHAYNVVWSIRACDNNWLFRSFQFNQLKLSNTAITLSNLWSTLWSDQTLTCPRKRFSHWLTRRTLLMFELRSMLQIDD